MPLPLEVAIARLVEIVQLPYENHSDSVADLVCGWMVARSLARQFAMRKPCYELIAGLSFVI